MSRLSLAHERELGGLVAGVDEAGRGPLAGGVFAAAVHVDLDLAEQLLSGAWSGVDDSKKLSAARREQLAETIRSTPGVVWAVASASPAEIDALNILNATHLAMRRAVEAVGDQLEVRRQDRKCLKVLVDGLPVRSLPCASRNLVKGDAKSLLVAAASILAKTARDADCLRMDREYPQYGFAGHKGYPTAAHCAALRKYGPCPEHRRSFGPVADMLLPGF